jgi:hypothetical protein
MGQYGNQPDFGTRAGEGKISGDPTDPTSATNLGSAALYIGTGGTLICRVVGGNANYVDDADPQSGYTIFYNIPNGTFFPVIVDCIWSSDGGEASTDCDNIVALY